MANRIPQATYLLLTTTLLITLASGCGQDHRLVNLAKEAADRQAEQNKEVMQLSQGVTESNKSLIEADGKTREEVLKLQRDLVERDDKGRQDLNALERETHSAASQERSNLDRQREDLEDERRQIVGERNRDPIIAAAITGLGIVLACLAPIILAVFLLRGLHRQEPSDRELAELLVQEIASDRSVLFGPETAEHPCLPHDIPASRPVIGSAGEKRAD